MFLFLEYRQTHFPGAVCAKEDGKTSNFQPKPRTNSFGKIPNFASSRMFTIDFKLADIKRESSVAYLLKLRKNLSQDFQDNFIFYKNAVKRKADILYFF